MRITVAIALLGIVSIEALVWDEGIVDPSEDELNNIILPVAVPKGYVEDVYNQIRDPVDLVGDYFGDVRETAEETEGEEDKQWSTDEYVGYESSCFPCV